MILHFLKSVGILGVIISTSVAWSNEGFDVGASATLAPVRGTAWVSCQEPSGYVTPSKFIGCRGWLFQPEELSYFVGEPGLQADQIRLTVTHPSGKQVSQKQKYDSSSGKSEKPFALWGGSLFNKALMKLGKNLVRFEYLNANKQVIKSGQFEFAVHEGEDWINCQTASIGHTSNISCFNEQALCQKYFEHVYYTCGQ